MGIVDNEKQAPHGKRAVCGNGQAGAGQAK